MNKEISEKIEYERDIIKEESIKLRREAKVYHTCPNCNKPVTGNRLYCCYDCAAEFRIKYDYSQTSEILREYARQLKQEYEKNHPKKETEPWSEPVARKEHKCEICELEIPKGEKCLKYTSLPYFDEDFIDHPYESTYYHENCMEFITDYLDLDEWSPDMIWDVFGDASKELKIPVEKIREMVRNGEDMEKIAEAGNW